MSVGLRAAQDAAGLTNRELARRVGASVSLVRRWRKGHRMRGRVYRERLSRVLGCDLERTVV